MIRQLIAMTIKDLQVLFKDTGGIATLFLMPAMFLFVMSNALAGSFTRDDSLIDVLVVNEDRGAIGATLVDSLKSGGGFNVQTDWEGATLTREALTRESAEQLIIDQKYSIALVIPAEFSDQIRSQIGAQNPTPAPIDLIVDPATSEQMLGPVKGAVAGLAQQAAMSSLMPMGIDLILSSIEQNGGSIPAPMRAQLTTNTDQTSTLGGGNLVELNQVQPAGMTVEQFPNTVQQNVPGWTLFGVFFIAQLVATSILEEKKVGSFRRLLAAPMSRATLLLGKLLPYLIINLIQIALMFAVGVFLLPLTGLPRLELGQHPESLILVSVCASLAANGLGLLLAAVGKTVEQVGGLSSLLVVTMAAVGGVMVPRFVMPEFMQTLSLVSPHAWALSAYQDILVRGYGIAQILPACGALLLFAAAFFGIAVLKFKWD
ncbi:MAG: ABC transporter permease [Chloroflexi bacterium]|nr:ABC transporter permease [Chloroflexota bacterium]